MSKDHLEPELWWPVGIERAIRRSIARSLDRSLDHSLDRSAARSLDRSIVWSLARLLARSFAHAIARSPDRSLGRYICYACFVAMTHAYTKAIVHACTTAIVHVCTMVMVLVWSIALVHACIMATVNSCILAIVRMCKGVRTPPFPHPLPASSPVRNKKLRRYLVENWQISCSLAFWNLVRRSILTLGSFLGQWIHWQWYSLDLSVSVIRKKAVQHASRVGGWREAAPRRWTFFIYCES